MISATYLKPRKKKYKGGGQRDRVNQEVILNNIEEIKIVLQTN